MTATQYYVVCTSTGAVVNAVLSVKPPEDILAAFPNPDALELKTEEQLSQKQLENYEYWGRRH
jgi:hypothetical protein